MNAIQDNTRLPRPWQGVSQQEFEPQMNADERRWQRAGGDSPRDPSMMLRRSQFRPHLRASAVPASFFLAAALPLAGLPQGTRCPQCLCPSRRALGLALERARTSGGTPPGGKRSVHRDVVAVALPLMEVARAGAPRLNRSRRCVPAASVAWCGVRSLNRRWHVCLAISRHATLGHSVEESAKSGTVR